MDRLVSIERGESVAILTILNPPVNALSREVAAALREAFDSVDAERIIITGSGKMFVAGADIREIQRIVSGEVEADLNYLNDLLNHIESSGRTVVIAMNGGALGIGLELALAGHYRVLKAGASVGLPEVKLGLIPGAGGTQRLTRLAGAETALRVILSGKPVRAEEALSLGIVDEVIDGDVVERAKAIVAGRRTNQLVADPQVNWPSLETRQTAPRRALAAIAGAVLSGSDFNAGLAAEAEQFALCLKDPQARAMIHLFFAERETSKVPGLAKGTTAAAIQQVEKEGSEWRLITDQGVTEMRLSPNERAVEIRYPEGMPAPVARAALDVVQSVGKVAVFCRTSEGWLGNADWTQVDTSMAFRPSDIDVLAVRGFDYPEELGGPSFDQSITPSHTSEALREPLK